MSAEDEAPTGPAPPVNVEDDEVPAGPPPSLSDEARAGLTPLAPGERPPALLVSVAVAGVAAAGVIAGVLSSHDLSRRGGSVPGGAFLAAVLLLLALNMLRRRYWAVLGFEGLLAFQVLVASLALVLARTLLAAAACLTAIALGGLLFWKLIRVMGRIQAGDRRPPSTGPSPPSAGTLDNKRLR